MTDQAAAFLDADRFMEPAAACAGLRVRSADPANQATVILTTALNPDPFGNRSASWPEA